MLVVEVASDLKDKAIDIKDEIAYINLLGELINNKFVYGVIGKPSFGAVTKIVSKEKVPLIISEENTEENKFLCLGKSAIYSGVDVNVESMICLMENSLFVL